jgi:hypothetical protein
MRTIKDYMDFVKNVRDNIPQQTEGIINRNKAEIIDLNRQGQLYAKGEDSLGLDLKPYAFFTVEIKQLLGQPYDRTTLNYSGAFYDGFYLTVDKDNLILTFNSNDRKTPDLIGKYGKNIFGLNYDNQQKLNYEIIKPELDKYIRQYL